ncbi:MAG: hypothetical protein ACYDCL_18485 [Myxococcales bacterium]
MESAPSLATPASPTAGSSLALRLWRSRAAWRLAVFLGALALQGGSAWHRYSPDRWLYRDGSFYFNTVRGIVENGSLDQSHLHPRSWFNGKLGWNYDLTDDWSNVSVGRDGTTWYPKHPLLMPILSVPFYLAFGDVGTLVFNVLCAALATLLAAELACAFTARWAASLIGFGIGAVPLIVREAYGFNNDLFYATLVVGAAVCLANRQLVRGGLLAGFAVFAKITNVFFLVPFGLWALATRDRKLVGRFAAACSVGILVTLIVNWVLFGAPWITAYHRVLIVHHGAQEIQPHTRLFHRDFWTGLRALWGWPEWRDPQGRGLMAVFPAYLPALLGTGVLAWRRRFVEAAVFLFALGWPLLFFAKYDWYRDDFCDPVYFLCAAPLAAWAGLFFAPAPEPATPARLWRWGLGGTAGCLALLIAGRGALALAHRGPYTLVGDVKHAEVFLGDIPCDYFNNQVHRWECSGFDRGSEWLMTGVTLDGAPVFDGRERTMIALNPHPQGLPRRLIFHVPMGRSFTLWHGIPDGAPAGLPVDLRVVIDGQPVAHETDDGPGLRRLDLDTSRFQAGRHDLELDVTGSANPRRWYYVDGAVD